MNTSLINKTKNTVLADKVLFGQDFFKRIIGLLGKKEFSQGQALVLKPCAAVHTFFMFFPIDVLFVDSNNKIIAAIPNLQPFRISAFYFSAKFAIELPPGVIKSSLTEKDDRIDFIPRQS